MNVQGGSSGASSVAKTLFSAPSQDSAKRPAREEKKDDKDTVAAPKTDDLPPLPDDSEEESQVCRQRERERVCVCVVHATLSHRVGGSSCMFHFPKWHEMTAWFKNNPYS
jgi:hypothetical protein